MAVLLVQGFFRWPHPMPRLLVLAGVVLALAGIAIVIWARASLGGAFTMFPQPKERDAPVASGAYRFARHPMYGGLLLLLGGISLARSLPALVLTVGLAVLWWGKSIEEERRLVEMFPGYGAYRARVPGRFFPLPWPRGDAP